MNTKSFKGVSTVALLLAAALMLAGLFTLQAAQAQQWPTQPGSHPETFDTPWDGRARAVRVHLPIGFDMTDGIARPLVVALHGGGGNGQTFEGTTGYDLKADAENFIVVFPTGTGNPRTWNADMTSAVKGSPCVYLCGCFLMVIVRAMERDGASNSDG